MRDLFISADKAIDAADITWKQPGRGVYPHDFDRLIGSKVQQHIAEDTIFQWGTFTK
jgi:sialic acid synthase SpsE